VIATTQSDDIPAGAFKDELQNARRVRDGHFKGKVSRSLLPVLYEFPEAIGRHRERWGDPANWPMVMPNLGRSVVLESLVADWQTEQSKNEQAIRIWASQHLNIEMGLGLTTDGWAGSEFWVNATDDTLTLESLIERSETVVVGVDGGGLDDLFGLAVLGREKETKHWLSWSHAWCHRGVLNRLDDVSAIIDIIARIKEAGVLACVALDIEGPYGEFVDALDTIEVTEASEQIVGIGQGYRLMGAIKTVERKLANGTMTHARSSLMEWTVGNVKIEPTATAIRATKQNAGDAKIDAWCALMDAATVMVKNPSGAQSSVFVV
jgi:phage terminase large subunit-like protein